MRLLINFTLIGLLLLCSCRDKKIEALVDDNTVRIDKLFRDSLSKDIAYFYKYFSLTKDTINFRYTPPGIHVMDQSYFLYAMEEAPLYREVNKQSELYRLLRITFLRKPILYKLEKTDEVITLTIKTTNGVSPHYSGVLDFIAQRKISIEEWNSFKELVNQTGFWDTSTTSKKQEVLGTDGEDWLLEGVSSAQYHALYRWSPQEKQFKDLNAFLLEYSKSFCDSFQLGVVYGR